MAPSLAIFFLYWAAYCILVLIASKRDALTKFVWILAENALAKLAIAPPESSSRSLILTISAAVEKFSR